jgi:hypothetical protein
MGGGDMSMDKSYDAGYQAGLDALETLAKSGAFFTRRPNRRDYSEHAGLAGLMAVVMHAAYAMAPSEKIVEELIKFSQEQAIENWRKEDAT